MKFNRFIAAFLVVAVSALGIVSVSGAAKHPAYPLGHAKKCRPDYFKSTHVRRVRGKRVRFVACVYRAPVTTTTKGGDPPTAISLSASESPAIVGDVITYSMTVADVLTSTLGAVYMTDNGTTLSGCVGPTATTQGSLAYSCTETYAAADVGSHLIVGVFLGDATYGQSAGQLSEQVDLTAPVTTTTTVSVGAPAPTGTATTSTTTTSTTTTTTTQPPPTISVSISGCGSSSVNANVVFSATVSGSAGTPPSINAGFSWGSSGGTLYGGAGGNGANFAEYHFDTAGTFTVTVSFVAGYAPGQSGPYAGISGSASCQEVIS